MEARACPCALGVAAPGSSMEPGEGKPSRSKSREGRAGWGTEERVGSGRALGLEDASETQECNRLVRKIRGVDTELPLGVRGHKVSCAIEGGRLIHEGRGKLSVVRLRRFVLQHGHTPLSVGTALSASSDCSSVFLSVGSSFTEAGSASAAGRVSAELPRSSVTEVQESDTPMVQASSFLGARTGAGVVSGVAHGSE